jgi:tetratricopeptide (TPR) repeat protein
LSEQPFEAVRLAELERIPGAFETTPLRVRFGIRSFGVNAYTAPEAGGELIEEHDELGAGAGGHEELYVVLEGHARFTVAGEHVDAPAGTLVFVRDPAARRHAIAQAPGTTVLVVGGTPGEAFEPSPWESWLVAAPHYLRKDYARALEIMREALAQHPDNANVLYNLACCESLGGEPERALEHLARALELDPRAREWARSDSDFDPVRADPCFPVG